MPLEVTVDRYVHLNLIGLNQDLVFDLLDLGTHENPVYSKVKKLGYGAYNVDRYCYSFQREVSEKEDRIYFWRGLLKPVLKLLKKYGIDYVLQDDRLWLDPVDLSSCSVQLRGYQKKPYKQMIKKQQTLLQAPAGSGKSEMLLALAAYYEQPTLVLVWQQSQQRTWVDRIAARFDFEAGGIGGAFKKPIIKPITVGMVQSVFRRRDHYAQMFGCLLCDEVQRFGAKSLHETVNAFPAAIRVGASDDERRSDGKEFLIYSLFGKVGALVEFGIGQCDVAIHIVPTETKFAFESWSDAITRLISDKARNDQIIDLCISEVKNGERVLIFSDRVDHCLYLCGRLEDKGISAGLLIGGSEWKSEAERTEQGLRDGTVSVGVGTSVAEQSVNIPPLSVGIMTCASADTKMLRFRQMRGRVARPYEGKKAKIYYLWDRYVYPLKRKVHNIHEVYDADIVPYQTKKGFRRK